MGVGLSQELPPPLSLPLRHARDRHRAFLSRNGHPLSLKVLVISLNVIGGLALASSILPSTYHVFPRLPPSIYMNNGPEDVLPRLIPNGLRHPYQEALFPKQHIQSSIIHFYL